MNFEILIDHFGSQYHYGSIHTQIKISAVFCVISGLNTNMVRFILLTFLQQDEAFLPRLNTTMVRFILYTLKQKVFLSKVSIPLWFDSYYTSKPYKVTEHFTSQYHYGSIHTKYVQSKDKKLH